MDSMRSLNTSLPHPRPQPPEQLLSAFKTAALSVTNLYKTAVTDQLSSRQSGYQDALDDLLSFLDKENLGVQDGEGWKIRQWATERFERTSYGPQSSESDDERGDTEKRARSSSPALERKTTHDAPVGREDSPASSPMRTESAPPQTSTQNEPEPTERPSSFRFTAAPSPEMQMQSTDSPISNQQQGYEGESGTSETAPIRVEVVNRGSRTSHRNSSNRHNTRALNREFTFTSGSKRKFQFPEFFDISNVGNWRDRDSFGGGGKRGRFV
jgi:hypothetical protein